MKDKKVILITACCLVIVGLILYVKNKKDVMPDSSEFVVGTAAHYAPWMSINEQGQYEGFDYDVAESVSKELGKKLVLKDLGSMAALFIALEQGSIDAIIWGISITKDRLARISMVHYNGDSVTSYPILFWNADMKKNIKNMSDMAGMTVSVESASAQDSALSAYEFINKKFIEKVDDGLLDIQYKKSDAVIVEQAIAHKFLAKYPDLVMLEMPLSDDYKVYGVGICIKKTNTTLTEQVEQAVQRLKASGALQRYEQKWGIV